MAQSEIKTQQKYKYTVDVDGLPVGICQNFTIPEIERTEAQYGAGANVNVKVAGKKKVSDATMKCLVNDTKYFHEWDERGDKRLMIVKLTDNAGAIQRQYELENCWVKKIKPDELDTKAEGTELMMEEITFSVENVIVK
jgi:phage tail-like protein